MDLMYGQPVGFSDVRILAAWARSIKVMTTNSEGGQVKFSLLVDHPEQVQYLRGFRSISQGLVPSVHIKLNAGSSISGVWHNSHGFEELADAVLDLHSTGNILLAGIYAHTSHSIFSGDGDHQENMVEAISLLGCQLNFLWQAAHVILKKAEDKVVALGDTPLVLSADVRCLEVLEQLMSTAKATGSLDVNDPVVNAAAGLLWTLKKIRCSGFATMEIHGNNYATMDLQQLAIAQTMGTSTSWDDMAFSVLTDVRSVYYQDENGNKSPEVLVGAGSLALGKEECKAFEGWGLVVPWSSLDHSEPAEVGDRAFAEEQALFPSRQLLNRRLRVQDYEGWVVKKVSQENGLLTRHQPQSQPLCSKVVESDDRLNGPDQQLHEDTKSRNIKVGQKIRIWPNRASIAMNHFSQCFIVDSDRDGEQDEIVGVWSDGE